MFGGGQEKVIRFFYLYTFIFLFLNEGAGDWSQDLVRAEPVLHHWAAPSPLEAHFCNYFNTTFFSSWILFIAQTALQQ